jgi:MFS family permease
MLLANGNVNGILTTTFRRSALQQLTRDGWLLFGTRFARLFAYNAMSVVLVLYLKSIGVSESQTGILLTLTLVGDTLVSLWLTTRADRMGRRRVLWIGATLITAAGLVFGSTTNLLILTIAGTIGVISPSGNEVGPFLPIEQAALSHVVASRVRTSLFAWYTVFGAFATAIGSLFSGMLAQSLETGGFGKVGSYRTILFLYAAVGAVLALLFNGVSSAAEMDLSDTASAPTPTVLGIGHSRRLVWKLSSLFAVDSFAGGFVIQSFAAYWFYLRFGVNPATLGSIFFGANILAGISALVASRLASRFGLVNTMVFTHLPSNVLLIFVPLMPSLSLAVLVLFLRFSISQMDVPTRQSYTMAVVRPEERSATAGITGVARTTGAAIAPLFAGFLFARPALMSSPFFIAGALKILYDLLLYREFAKLRPPEEMVGAE